MKKLCMVIVVLVMFLWSVPVLAIDLGNGVETGMGLSKVSQKIDLEHYKTSKGLTAYKRVDYSVYYFFDEDTHILLYKLQFFLDKKWDVMAEKVGNICGNPVILKSEIGYTYFFNKGDLGFKLMDYNDEAFQLWIGSVSLWNDFVDRHQGMRAFPAK